MKKYFYCNREIESPTVTNPSEYTNLDHDKRKILSIETNRRRRDMALRVKKQIDKEEERRKEILRQRRENHKNMSAKMRSTQKPKPWTMDQTFNLIRDNSSNSNINLTDRDFQLLTYRTVLESAWSDVMENCRSPMAKYSGTTPINKHKINDFYRKTFESKVEAQEQSLKQKQNLEMTEFSKILDDTIHELNKGGSTNISQREKEQNFTFRKEIGSSDLKKCEIPTTISHINIEDVIEDFSEDSSVENVEVDDCNKKTIIPEIDKVETVESISTPSAVKNSKKNTLTNPIKSILKKEMSAKFNSNIDLSENVLRDSIEITRLKSARIKRSNSFSQGINYLTNDKVDWEERNYVEDLSDRKIVRFADDHSSRTKSNGSIAPDGKKKIFLDNQRNTINSKLTKTVTIPNSTSLKPPLHPRSMQEGSYLQSTFKKSAPVFHPPAKPQKINAELLDREIGFGNQKKSVMKNPQSTENKSTTGQAGEYTIPLDKTPTEKEIDLLWAEVRECLSKSRNPYKTDSVGTPAGVSVRTVDSCSESSVRSAPAWQRNINIKKAPTLQVRHHGQIGPKQNIYQGQEPPLKDLVIVHDRHEPRVNSGITQQPLSVISRQDHGFKQVSESLEEFLATENACHTSQSQKRNFPQPLLNRPRFMPPTKSNIFITSPSSTIQNSPFPSSIQKTQLSVDEEKVKMSLDRLNERLKNVTNFL